MYSKITFTVNYTQRNIIMVCKNGIVTVTACAVLAQTHTDGQHTHMRIRELYICAKYPFIAHRMHVAKACVTMRDDRVL